MESSRFVSLDGLLFSVCFSGSDSSTSLASVMKVLYDKMAPDLIFLHPRPSTEHSQYCTTGNTARHLWVTMVSEAEAAAWKRQIGAEVSAVEDRDGRVMRNPDDPNRSNSRRAKSSTTAGR
jgi:hypothetical protein